MTHVVTCISEVSEAEQCARQNTSGSFHVPGHLGDIIPGFGCRAGAFDPAAHLHRRGSNASDWDRVGRAGQSNCSNAQQSASPKATKTRILPVW